MTADNIVKTARDEALFEKETLRFRSLRTAEFGEGDNQRRIYMNND